MIKKIVTIGVLLVNFTGLLAKLLPTHTTYLTLQTNIVKSFNLDKSIYYPIGFGPKRFINTAPKVLIGGFGIGTTLLFPQKNNRYIKANIDASRHVYWGDFILFRDANGIASGLEKGAIADFQLGLSGVYHIPVYKKLSLGIGAGCRTQLISVMNIEFWGQTNVRESRTLSINPYKRFMPIIPIECVIKQKNIMYTLRYEQAMLNKYKSSIASFQKENYGLLIGEVAIRVK